MNKALQSFASEFMDFSRENFVEKKTTWPENISNSSILTVFLPSLFSLVKWCNEIGGGIQPQVTDVCSVSTRKGQYTAD